MRYCVILCDVYIDAMEQKDSEYNITKLIKYKLNCFSSLVITLLIFFETLDGVF